MQSKATHALLMRLLWAAVHDAPEPQADGPWYVVEAQKQIAQAGRGAASSRAAKQASASAIKTPRERRSRFMKDLLVDAAPAIVAAARKYYTSGGSGGYEEVSRIARNDSLSLGNSLSTTDQTMSVSISKY